jgi:hypothetical protein
LESALAESSIAQGYCQRLGKSKFHHFSSRPFSLPVLLSGLDILCSEAYVFEFPAACNSKGTWRPLPCLICIVSPDEPPVVVNCGQISCVELFLFRIFCQRMMLHWALRAKNPLVVVVSLMVAKVGQFVMMTRRPFMTLT